MISLKDKLKPYLMLAPVLIILVTIFVSGIVTALSQSFGYFEAVGLKDFTFKYYREVLTDSGFLSSLTFSLYTALVSSLIAIILGVILAYSMLQMGGSFEGLYKMPIIVPHIVSALLVYNMLSQSGIIPRIFYGAGLISDQGQFPSVLYEKNGVGIIIAYLWKEIPFVALTTYAILGKVSSRLGDAARNLGANKRQVFFYIILPLIIPSLLSSFIIIFAFSFGAYELPLLLGPTTPKTLGVKAFIEYNNPVLQNRPYAMVINIIITAIGFLLTFIYLRIFERLTKYEG